MESTDATTSQIAERLLEQLGATDITVWTGSGRLVASVGQSRFQLSPEKPSSSQFRTARQERSLAWVEGLDDAVPASLANAQIKALVPVFSSILGLSPETRYMLVSRALPEGLVANAMAVQSANREYQERALGREGLKRMYIGTLTLSLFL
ncbi:MAG: PAS domain-containing sensor histidine kinase, partial [Rhodoferax sp.]